MKRFLLVLVLSIACLAVLAVPAVASAPWAPDFRLEANTAYVFAYADGSWFEVTDVAAGTFVGHWVEYDEYGNFVAPADPIPADLDIVMQESWKGWTFGLMKKLPTAFEIQLSIPEAGVDVSYEEARAFWGVAPYLWDEYWVNALGTFPAFNEHMGAGIYATRWLMPLGKLEPGTYTVYYDERWVKTWTNMDQFYDDFGEPINHSPWHAKSGERWSTSFTFTVE
jgi:hypothetical protein